jgi:hypothetical protein
MSWGTKIFLSFVVFVALIISLVVISVKQEFYLVADDYYEQELIYQDQIDRMENVLQAGLKPDIQVSKVHKSMILTFPEELKSGLTSGEIVFFRPSNANLDQRFLLQLDENGIQRINLQTFQKGLWKAQITWKSADREFYVEKVLVL